MEIEYTFIMPCLNEESSIKYCIDEIKKCIKDKKLNAEILIADNNSNDNSVKIALKNNVRVVIEKNKGYGNTLINGIKNANGRYCIIGDSDGTYDFYNIKEYIYNLKNGYDLIIGNRFMKKQDNSTMKISHKIGVKLLSKFANLLFHTEIHDYHCGLRAFNTEKIRALNLKQGGMEYASEMIIASKLNNLKITEVQTKLRKPVRNGKSHLKIIKDGVRHIKLIIHMFIIKKFRTN